MNQLTIASHNHKLELWIGRIKACRNSNQTVAAWCSAHDISIKCYYYWMRKIKTEAFEALPKERKSKILSQNPTSTFAQVTLPVEATRNACAIKLRVNNLLLEIQNGADGQTIEHTLHALKTLC